MTGSGGGLGVWGSLLLLGLCSWSGARAAAPNPVGDPTVEAQTNSSISLRWEAPNGTNHLNYTYWVRWTGQGDKKGTQNTTDTSFTVEGLDSGSWYEFSVWVEAGGLNSSQKTLSAATAPNPVGNLMVEDRTSGSISLRWEAPVGPNPQNYTYWVQWPVDGDKNETRTTKNTSYKVEGLQAASSYEFSVWVEKNRVPGSRVTLRASTAPNPVRNLSVEAQTNSSISLHWEAPDGPNPQNYTYWVRWTGQEGKNGAQNTKDTSFTVNGLDPGSSYEFSVWVEAGGLNSSQKTLSAATAPNPVRNLTVEARTNSSIGLRWEAPDGPNPQNYTYWVQWTGQGDKKGTQNTTDTSFTVEGLNSGSWYKFSVWVEAGGLSSSQKTVSPATAPNPVRKLSVEAQTNSSISLHWEAPDGPNPQNYTYWVRWTGQGGKNGAQNTTDTRFTVEGLDPGSSYEFSVWVEAGGLSSSQKTLSAATAPNPVRNLTVEAQTNSSIGLRWEAPDGPNPQNYTYWVQWTRQGDKNETRTMTDTSYKVEGLQAASSYEFSMWAEKNGVPGSRVTLRASTVPNPVGNLSVEARTNSSISLRWEAPDGPNPQNYTYWVRWTGQGSKNGAQNTTDTRFTVEGLDPGSSYEFSVWVEAGGLSSSQKTLSAATAPNPVRNLTVEAQTNSSISLRWEAPDGPNPQNYTYWVQWPVDGDKNETGTTTDTSYKVEGLQAASSYEFSVWAEKNRVPGSRVTLQASTAPNPVGNLSVEAQTNSSISLGWEAPDGPNPQNYTYWVRWTGQGSKNGAQNTTDTRFTVEGLDPGSSYEFSVWVEAGGLSSSQKTLSAATAPNPVRNLSVEAQTNSSISLRWEAPDGPNPQNYTYWVQWPVDGDKNETGTTTDTSYKVEGLQAASSYEFSVWVEKNRVPGSRVTLQASTAPNTVGNLSVEARTNSSISLRWEAPTDPHPHLYVYVVQWASVGLPQRERGPQGYRAYQTGRTNETSYEVQGLEPGTRYNFSVWAERSLVASSILSRTASTDPDPVTITSCNSISGGYGVFLTWSCPRGGYEAFELKVGGQQSSQDRSSCESGASVWGLQPARSYPATVATVWAGMRAPAASVTCHTQSAGVIAGSIVGVLFLVLVVCLLIFFLKKRHRKSQKESASSFPEEILAADFADHVKKNEKDSNCGFAEEYQRLALEGQGQSQMVASAPENSTKNRYRNVLPYDWSRVPLKPVPGEPGSDYINASFMPGLWSPREFIATQGPLPQTVGDFWRLVWEQKSHTLVMLTNCVEFGRVKCEHYWPLDAKPCTHGHLQVTLEDEKVTEHWAVRQLKLCHTQKRETLSVRQFHYLAWPDHSVPHTPDPLLAFWKMLRQWLDQNPRGGPPIVHCSAGVGRTGTLIALDVLLRQLECEGVVGPFSYMSKMRESRPLMVQTEAQYVFLHQCILRFLQQRSPAPTQKAVIYENLMFEHEEAH